jgi:hypothetical protein
VSTDPLVLEAQARVKAITTLLAAGDHAAIAALIDESWIPAQEIQRVLAEAGVVARSLPQSAMDELVFRREGAGAMEGVYLHVPIWSDDGPSGLRLLISTQEEDGRFRCQIHSVSYSDPERGRLEVQTGRQIEDEQRYGPILTFDDLGREALSSPQRDAVVNAVRADDDLYWQTREWRDWDQVDLVMPPGDPSTWSASVVRRQRDPAWAAIDVQMWTAQEGASILTLVLQVEAQPDGSAIAWIENLLVP